VLGSLWSRTRRDHLAQAVDDRVRTGLGPVAGRDDTVVSVSAVGVGAASGDSLGFARLADRIHYAASTMKLPLLIAAFRLAEVGRLDLDSTAVVHNEFASAHDGSVFSLEQDDDQDDETWERLGSPVDLRTLARHAVVKSGNLATNILWEHVGAEAVAAVLADSGCSPLTRLPRGIGDVVARDAGLVNDVTAADLTRVMLALARRRIASTRTCVEVEEILAAQEHRAQVPAGLPEGTYVANKTGWVDGVAHDVALVRPAEAPSYVVSICTTADAPEETLYRVNAQISAAVWTAFVEVSG
jgi:beta-lactamase class A